MLVAALLCSCHSDDTSTPDDGQAVDSGLIVRWSSLPESWPGDIGDGITIERARFKIDSLRVIGDAGPGDPRTTATMFEIRWDADSRPPDFPFGEAPPGLYSQVSLAIDCRCSLSDNSYEIRGRAFVNGTDYEYRIEDENPLSFSIPIDKMLSPGDTTYVGLRVDFIHAISSVDFTMFRLEEGRLELDTQNTQMPTFRQKLVESFQIVSVDGAAATGDR